MMERCKRWGYRAAVTLAAAAMTWTALSEDSASPSTSHRSTSALLPRGMENGASGSDTALPHPESHVLSAAARGLSSSAGVDAAGFRLGMSVEQTLAALDGRRLTGRVVMEYAAVSSTGEVTRATTDRRHDVLPAGVGRFVIAIETLPGESSKEQDPEAFHFEFALPPDDNVLLRVTRRARGHIRETGAIIAKEQLLDAVREKYGSAMVMSSRATGRPGRETLSLKWLFPEHGRDCNPDFSRPASGRDEVLSSTPRPSSKPGIDVPRNCATSVIMKVTLADTSNNPIVERIHTTFGNDSEITLNGRRHATYRRELRERSEEQHRAEIVSAALLGGSALEREQ